jgi:hypothetical protein
VTGVLVMAGPRTRWSAVRWSEGDDDDDTRPPARRSDEFMTTGTWAQ